MLTEQLLDSPSHFLRGFGVYCRDNGIPESEALRGLQKAAATFPQVELELRKTALDPKSVKSSAGLLSGLDGKAWKGVKSVFGYGDEIAAGAGAGNVAKPLTKAAPPLVTGARVPGGVLGGVAPSGQLNTVAPVSVNSSTVRPIVTPSSGGLLPKPTLPPVQNAATADARRVAADTQNARIAARQAESALPPGMRSSGRTAPTTAKPAATPPPGPTTATTPATTPASTPAPRDGLGQLRRPAQLTTATTPATTPASTPATKDGLGQVRDIAIGGTAGQRALTAGSGAVGAGVGGYVESQDPDSNWLDTTSAAIHGGLRGLLYSRLGTGSFNAAKNFGAGTASSLATAAGSVAGSVLTDSQLGGHVDKSVDYPFRPAYRYLDGHPGLSDPGVNLKPGHKGSIADLHARYEQSGQALTDQAENPSWNQDPSRLGENRTKLDARYAQELEAKKLDPTMSQVANAVNTPAFSGNMTKPQETADYLKLNGKPGQDSFRAVLVSMESRLQAAGPDGLKDPQNQKLALDYVNGQLALTSAAGGKDVEALKASATNALKDGVISQEELGGFLQTDAGKQAFQTYSSQFFGPNGPTLDPSAILGNFTEMLSKKPHQAAALMIGIPVAMFGVMSALGGEGGMGALLATVLGGGAAAYGAGMFGGEGVRRLFGAATAPAANRPAATTASPAVVGANQMSNAQFAANNPQAAYAKAVAARPALSKLIPNQMKFDEALRSHELDRSNGLKSWVAANMPRFGGVPLGNIEETTAELMKTLDEPSGVYES